MFSFENVMINLPLIVINDSDGRGRVGWAVVSPISHNGRKKETNKHKKQIANKQAHNVHISLDFLPFDKWHAMTHDMLWHTIMSHGR